MQIGIIGFGTFGQFMAEHLKSKAGVFVTDIVDKTKEAKKIGVTFTTLDKVCSKKIVILSVPMSVFVKTLKTIKDKLTPGTLVLDVCSLKIFSCKSMKEILPENIEIIGTHPLFGADSAKHSIKNMKLALVNVRSKKISEVQNFCESLGLQVFVTSAEDHDKKMAYTQALTHFIGKVAERMKLTRFDVCTKTYEDLMDIIDIIKNDDSRLFSDIQNMNSYAKKVRDQFIKESEKLNKELN